MNLEYIPRIDRPRYFPPLGDDPWYPEDFDEEEYRVEIS